MPSVLSRWTTQYTATARLQVARQSPIQPRLADSLQRDQENVPDPSGARTQLGKEARIT